MKTQRHFIVTIEGTDVPPDWAEKTEARLRSTLKYPFGESVQVRQQGTPLGSALPPPPPTNQCGHCWQHQPNCPHCDNPPLQGERQ